MVFSKELLIKLNTVVIEEIDKYKWIESEKAGYDIGRKRAAIEWIEKYYAKFLEYFLSTINGNNGVNGSAMNNV